jgi:hypothetical protein
MAKKKKSAQEADGDGSSRPGHSKAAGEPSTSALIICRNK